MCAREPHSASSRLARFIYSVGHRAIRLGIAPKSVVAIQVKDDIFHTTLALGLMHIGAATVSIGPVFPPGLRVDVVLTDTPEAFANGRAAKVVAVDLSWMAGKGVPVDERRVYNGSRRRHLPHRVDVRLHGRSESRCVHAQQPAGAACTLQSRVRKNIS
ncbi:MAG TPA: hypothetical protein VI137_10955 [Pseudolabrys sp.]